MGTNYLMPGEQGLSQAGYRSQMVQPKYPPPLIPVRHVNGGLRYDGSQYQPLDAVDLTAAPGYVDLHSFLFYASFRIHGASLVVVMGM